MTDQPQSTPKVVLPGFEDGIPDVPLEADPIIAAARDATELTEFGDASFMAPFEVLLESIRKEANLHQMGRLLMYRTLVRLLSNRLMIHRDFQQHPQIADVQITRPLLILGFPRTGTTFLHNLMACDPNARALLLWEGLYPSPPPEAESRDSDPRIGVVRQWVDAYNAISPQLASAHNLNPTGPEECLWLFEHTLADLIFELRANVPTYSRWLTENEDRVESYKYFRRLLQLLAWKCPGRHWVLKAPRHLFGLGALLEVFPDARIVQTHRNPAQVLPSLCSLTRYSRLMYSESFDADSVGAHWFTRLRGVFGYAMRVRQQHERDNDQSQFQDVLYRDLIDDPIATVKRIYDFHDYPYSDEFESRMKQWLVDNRQHKHGKHQYTLEQFGLDPVEVDRKFKSYRQHYQLD